MDDNTNSTPSPDDNKLDLTDKNLINEYEAKGIAAAELFVFELDSEIEISTQLLLEIHRIAFSELYELPRHKITDNVLQIFDGRAFQHKSLFVELNFLLPQNCQAETKPRLLPMCCYAVGFLFCQASLTKLSSSFTLKLISAFNALKTLNTVSIVALLALLSSLEI
jgi:hypothetical protein